MLAENQEEASPDKQQIKYMSNHNKDLKIHVVFQ